MITDPLFFAAAIPAVLLFGLSKGGFGGGVSLPALPLMALVVSPIQAAGIMLPLLLVMDVFAVWTYRHDWDRTNAFILIPGSILGIGIGWFLASYLTPAYIRLIIGVIGLVFGLNYWLNTFFNRAAQRKTTPDRLKGTFWGTISGFTSFLVHVGGPPYQVYMLPQRMDRVRYVATTAIVFAVTNVLKTIPYFALGQFNPTNLKTALALAPFAPIGVLVGVRVLKHISQERFYPIIYGVLLAVSIKLLWDGAQGVLSA